MVGERALEESTRNDQVGWKKNLAGQMGDFEKATAPAIPGSGQRFANSPKRQYNRRKFHLELMDREAPHPFQPHFKEMWHAGRDG